MKQLLLTVNLLLMTAITYAQSAEKEQVLNINRQLFKGTSEKIESLIRENMEDAFLFTTANADVMDKETYISGFALHPAISIPLLNTSEENVIIVGNTAILTALAHINISRNNAAPNDLWERITGTYIMQDGRWKILALHATYLPKK